ncbi:MAG: DNA polymerase III subunit gamma/tau [Elusimicrobiota bacterium]
MTHRHRSLSAKYRPAYFRDVVGQEAASQALSNAVALGRIHPAYCFYGSRGSGKTSMARILARALNCASRLQGRPRDDRDSQAPASGVKVEVSKAEPCGQCASCLEIAEGRSLDVLEIDAASHTQVEHIREVILDTINLAPVRERYRIFIIDEVHMLSAGSFNAMLKTLEEPPDHALFILATTNLAKVPATVISRTQSFPFRSLSIIEIKGHLSGIIQKEGIGVEEEAIEELARAAGGSLRDALSLLEQMASLVGGSSGTIRRQDLTRLLGFVEEKAVEGLIEALADNRDFEQARIIVQDQLLKWGHTPSQLLGSLYRRLAARLIESLGAGAQPQARRLYLLARHVTEIQSSLRFSPDPILACEVGLLGFLLIDSSGETAQPAGRVAMRPPEENKGKPSVVPSQRSVATEATEPMGRTRGASGAPSATAPPAAKSEIPVPVNAGPSPEPASARDSRPELPHNSEPSATALSDSVRFQNFLQAVGRESYGLYFDGAGIEPGEGGGHALILANDFYVEGMEKNKEKILVLWRTHFGSAPLHSFLNKGLARPSAPQPQTKPSAVPVPVEIPDDIKRMAKVFGGKIKRIKS